MAERSTYPGMTQPAATGYRADQIVEDSHYREPIDRSPGRLAGNSRRAGDASPEVQAECIDALIAASEKAGLTARQTAHVLAIARAESGFNPDAAAGTTSAFGLGQFVDRTGQGYGLNGQNRGDHREQSEALVAHYLDNAALAQRRGQNEDYIYKYHHDGPVRDYGGLKTGRESVSPYIDRYETFVRDHQRQRGFVASEQPPERTAVGRGGAGSRDDRAASSRDAMADGVLRKGENGAAVRGLQEELNRQGYTDAEGKPLAIDGRFGERTRQAVEAYQKANDLEPDGIAGPDTLNKLKETAGKPKQAEDSAHKGPVLSDSAHPDNKMYVQALEGLSQRKAGGGISDPDEMARAAARLVYEAKVSGLDRIDSVVYSADGKRVFAVQGNAEFGMRVVVDRNEVGSQSVADTSRALAEDVHAKLKAQPEPQQQSQARSASM